MDKSKLIRLVLIPILLGLVVTLIVRQLLDRPAPAKTAAAVEMAEVVAVGLQSPVAARSKLTEGSLTIRKVPREALTGQELTSLDQAAGTIATVELQPGEVVLQSRLVVEGEGALPYRIPAGKRATTIRIDELSGVAGHIEPGDLVDLVLVLPEKRLEESPDVPRRPASARLLYEGVLVLEKGPASAASAKSPDSPKLTSVTLALSPAAAVEVALAEQIGHIKLLLRPALAEPNAGGIITNEVKYNPAPLQ